MHVLVDQSALFLMGASKTTKSHKYREKLQHHLFLMGLRDDFESNHNQLFHCTPLPTIGQVLNKIAQEETRLHSHRSQHSDIALSTSSPTALIWHLSQPP